MYIYIHMYLYIDFNESSIKILKHLIQIKQHHKSVQIYIYVCMYVYMRVSMYACKQKCVQGE
jgi:hypothetical protein